MKRKPSLSSLKRKKLPSLAKLKRRLDILFSQWIRKRDQRSADGYGPCVTCGTFSKLQASHFIPRQHLAVRWDERNVHGACAYCNCWQHGNLIAYTLYMQNRYGQDVVDELMRLKRTTVKMTRSDYETLLEKYRD